jgi:hypothetical protein
MAVFAWQELTTFDLLLLPDGKASTSPIEVKAPWLLAVELFGDATHLRLMAEAGCWTAMPGLPECGADGLPGLAVPDSAVLLADCTPAGLIGRVGGSSALLKVGDTLPEGTDKPFAVGSHCVVKLPPKAVGPLFLGFNLRYRPVSVKALRVKISTATPTFSE